MIMANINSSRDSLNCPFHDSLHLAMFSGKGGVGKTTLSCAFARRWARIFPSEQILLLSTDPAHSLGDVLQIEVTDTPCPLSDLPNLQIQALDAHKLLQTFKAEHGKVLELLVERGSFVDGEDLTPIWDLNWPGVDELMGLLEIQRLLSRGASDRLGKIDRIVVDMAPSGHTLNLFGLNSFLDTFLESLELFQQKHRTLQFAFTKRHVTDEADVFLAQMKASQAAGRQMLEDKEFTACLVVAIAEPMSLLETKRFLQQLAIQKIPCGDVFINRLVEPSINNIGEEGNIEAGNIQSDRYSEQQELLQKFLALPEAKHLFGIPMQMSEPVGISALDRLIAQIAPIETISQTVSPRLVIPEKVLPSFPDFIEQGRKLILIGGKGGVGKTTVAAAIAMGMATRHRDRKIRVISIDPAHSLGDVFGMELGHYPQLVHADITNLTGQEIDTAIVFDEFRANYLTELANMMSGESDEPDDSIQLAYTPEAWQKIISQGLPGIDEILSLVTVIDLLEKQEQDLIILDTAPTGHLLRFLEMPNAMSDWLAWILRLWLKYQDVLGRVDLIERLRLLRRQVVLAQKKLTNPDYAEFIGVIQAQSAIISEQMRLTTSLEQMGIKQNFIVHNRYDSAGEVDPNLFPSQTIIRLPILPRSVEAGERVAIAATLIL
jgi:arsenite-transporting ATPase